MTQEINLENFHNRSFEVVDRDNEGKLIYSNITGLFQFIEQTGKSEIYLHFKDNCIYKFIYYEDQSY